MTYVPESRLQCFNVKYLHQYLCVFAACMSYFLNGYQWGYLSPALVKLGENGYHKIPPLSSYAQSWMVQWLTIGFTPGAFFASYSNQWIGRKNSLLCAFIPNLVAHLCTYFAMNVNMLYLSQFLRGFHTGWVFVTVPNYVSEIASPKLRGSFSAMGIVFMTIGSRVVSSTVQSVTSIETTALIGIIISLVDLPLVLSISESPYYCLMKNNERKSMDILKKLRNSQNIGKEFEEMKSIFNKNQQMKKSSSWIKLFSESINLKVTLLTAGAVTIFQLSGQLPLSHYAHKIIKGTGLNVSLLTISIFISATRLIPNLIGVFVIDSWGRKPLFILLCALSATGHFLIAFPMFLMDNTDTHNTKLLGILEFIGLAIFEIAEGFGFTHMAYTLAAELYPTNIKPKGASFLKILQSVEGLIVMQMFELLTNINQFIPFLCMAVASSFGVAFGILFVPETKSKSLSKIQEDLNLP
ncbi:facilitated trehalose transporter Tret1-2 homolog [Chrysoperla carnea]|uniref:facilitated trehalose transporter Tret1-2 homolog n=1 Tax=Chrysoperla carnea TaxID=189513 RepID=UPI001D0745AB|nr:facilitated trehalose transporter Tret1-2 homolog [Chrysoperla carnea]